MCWVMPPASPVGDRGLADLVEQRRLAVVDVAHDGHDRRAPLARGLVEPVDELVLLEGDVVDRVAELAGDQFGGVGVDHVVEGQAAHAHAPQDAEHGGRLLAHLVGQVGDLDDLVDADALLRVAHLLRGDPRGRTPRGDAHVADRHLAAAALGLGPLLALLADGGAAALLRLARVGDDHLLRAGAVGQRDEADDLRLGALRGGADDHAGLVADDATAGRRRRSRPAPGRVGLARGPIGAAGRRGRRGHAAGSRGALAEPLGAGLGLPRPRTGVLLGALLAVRAACWCRWSAAGGCR
jgi:hypothetical protein